MSDCVCYRNLTSSGKVALNMSVCLAAVAASDSEAEGEEGFFEGMVGCRDTFCTSGMKPRSSIRSASSRTRNLETQVFSGVNIITVGFCVVLGSL